MSDLDPRFQYHLVLDLGNSHLVGAFFIEDELLRSFRIDLQSNWQYTLKEELENVKIIHVLLGSVNSELNAQIILDLKALGLTVSLVDNLNLKNLILEIVEPKTVGADLVANAYGALKCSPGNSIVIDVGTAVTISAIRADRTFLGGAIYPGLKMSAKALAEFTDGLPYVNIQCPENPLGKDTETHIQSGVFYGLIATIHYFVETLKNLVFRGEKVNIIITGGITNRYSENPLEQKLKDDFQEALNPIVDVFEPYLTLIGLNEILKENEIYLKRYDEEEQLLLGV